MDKLDWSLRWLKNVWRVYVKFAEETAQVCHFFITQSYQLHAFHIWFKVQKLTCYSHIGASVSSIFEKRCHQWLFSKKNTVAKTRLTLSLGRYAGRWAFLCTAIKTFNNIDSISVSIKVDGCRSISRDSETVETCPRDHLLGRFKWVKSRIRYTLSDWRTQCVHTGLSSEDCQKIVFDGHDNLDLMSRAASLLDQLTAANSVLMSNILRALLDQQVRLQLAHDIVRNHQTSCYDKELLCEWAILKTPILCSSTDCILWLQYSYIGLCNLFSYQALKHLALTISYSPRILWQSHRIMIILYISRQILAMARAFSEFTMTSSASLAWRFTLAWSTLKDGDLHKCLCTCCISAVLSIQLRN